MKQESADTSTGPRTIIFIFIGEVLELKYV